MQKHPDFKNLFVVDHPLVQDKLSRMRDERTNMRDFRRLLKEIALLMGYELTRVLPIEKKSLKTPMTEMQAPFLAGPPPVIVPILRAGQGMGEGLMELLPDSPIGYIGLRRDETTHRPIEYLKKLPPYQEQVHIVVDPMLATGHSSEYAFHLLEKQGVAREKIRFMALVAAPEGVKVVEDAYPEVPIYVASLDERLNDNAFILPGLGDAGDRLFGTV